MHTDSSHKGRILIGESVQQTASRMKETLSDAGYQVETATDGEQCLKRAKEMKPALVILDLLLHKVHGIEVVKQLRADPATADTGVIVCTARDFKTDHVEAAVLGVHEYLVKPVEPETLAEKVNAFFHSRNSQAAAPAPEAEADSTARSDAFVPSFEEWGNRLALWGTRGSTPTPGARFLRHGGNTSCFCVTYGRDKFVFDAGSGIRELGGEIMAGKRRNIHLFITHTHWDHIQGFPFFVPAYVPGFEITIWGAELFGKDLRSVFRGQLDRDYFPVQMEDMNSNLDFRHLPDAPINLGDARITWEYSQHPGATVGYKIEVGGRRIAWVPDNEFLQGYTGDPTAITRQDPLVTPYRKMIQFLSDADTVVHEAQYTVEEYSGKIGWGHSSVSNACLLMKFAGVKRWVITHHDPGHDDNFLEKKLALIRRILREIGHECSVTNGYDGMTEYFE